jgi:hypothetical protein
VSEWTDNQVKFAYWMQFYDMIYQADDAPDDSIIADNDRVDQWFENKMKEVEASRRQVLAQKKGVGTRSAFNHESVTLY